jgi:hypothetical protein
MGFVDSTVARYISNFNGRSKHNEVRIFNDENVKEYNFIKIFEDACIYKKVSGSAETYF